MLEVSLFPFAYLRGNRKADEVPIAADRSKSSRKLDDTETMASTVAPPLPSSADTEASVALSFNQEGQHPVAQELASVRAEETPQQVETSGKLDADFVAFKAEAETLQVAKQSRDFLVVADGVQEKKEEATAENECAEQENSAPNLLVAGDSQAATTDESPLDVSASAEVAVEESEKASLDNGQDQYRPFRFVTPKDFDLLRVIGMGSFGKVLQVRHKQTKKILAMKVISKRLLRRKSGYIENVQAERNILTKVRHPFVVTMHCSFQSKEKLFIVMDFLAGGELFLRLGREGIFLEKQAAFYLSEIILALDHLHSLGVLHRDLKPEVSSTVVRVVSTMVRSDYRRLLWLTSYPA